MTKSESKPLIAEDTQSTCATLAKHFAMVGAQAAKVSGGIGGTALGLSATLCGVGEIHSGAVFAKIAGGCLLFSIASGGCSVACSKLEGEQEVVVKKAVAVSPQSVGMKI